MSDNLYTRFSQLTGERFSGFDVHTDRAIRSAYTKTKALHISAIGDKAKNTLRELDAIYSVIGTEEGRKAYNAQHIEQMLSHVTPVTETSIGLGERIAGKWRSARESTTDAMSKLKARITRPSAAKAVGEPQALPLVETASGAALEPILDGKTHIRLTAEQIPTPEPIKPTNVTAAGKVTSESVRTASAEKLAAAKAAEAQRQIARAERSEEMRAASAAEINAAKAAEAERTATMPARQEAAVAVTREKVAAANAAEAEAGASKAARVAAAEKAARASFQAQKGTIGQRFSANTANLAERATMPLIKRFRTKDPYKILGITPHTSQTAAMAAFEAKLSALGDMRVTSPRAQLEWQRLNDAYEAVYADLFERPKFTPPAVIMPERTSKIGAMMERAREKVASLSARITSTDKGNTIELATTAASEATTISAALEPLHDPNRLILTAEEMAKLKPPTVSALTGNLTLAEKQAAASASLAAQRAQALAAQQATAGETIAQTGRSLILHPTANAPAAVLAETPNLPILHPAASAPHGDIGAAASSEIKLISGPVYSSAELNGGRRISYLSNAVEHSPLRGKLLLAGGVVAAAAIGYFGNRKQEKYPMPPMPRPRAANWVEATQQPAISGELQR